MCDYFGRNHEHDELLLIALSCCKQEERKRKFIFLIEVYLSSEFTKRV